ncbi:hypothetical protein ZIOFF_041609 [Zingiber officinale]|uniref:Uncharacterized protein n=1 Tax=Zingiber officinale TaxID=94328 RepID=A0A8J5G7V1_ZINOF|nr:hypothetical protein ZIOFF_041609 [Zingiber officinale]
MEESSHSNGGGASLEIEANSPRDAESSFTPYLNSNRFCGTLPHTFSRLLRLHELDLSNNRFVGRFSFVVLRLLALCFLDLCFNDFEGPIVLVDDLAIPCKPEFFVWVVSALGRDKERLSDLDLDSLLALFDDLGSSGSSCRDSTSYDGFSPLIPKTRV